MKRIVLLIPFRKSPKTIAPIVDSSIKNLKKNEILPVFIDPAIDINTVQKNKWSAI